MGAIIALFTVDRFGRRKSVMIGATGTRSLSYSSSLLYLLAVYNSVYLDVNIDRLHIARGKQCRLLYGSCGLVSFQPHLRYRSARHPVLVRSRGGSPLFADCYQWSFVWNELGAQLHDRTSDPSRL